jgi:phosphoglycerol transferase MdoB-like AlkP superfamily enzyme
MPVHLILLVVAFVLLVLAAVIEWPRTNPPAPSGYGHPLGWAGLAAFVLAALVP